MRLDKDKIKSNLTEDDVIEILESLGAQNHRYDINNNLIFNTVCHNIRNGNEKLYYYPEGKSFHCYTDCGDSFDIFDLVRRNKGLHGEDLSFYGAVKYVADITGYYVSSKRQKGFGKRDFLIDDWDFIDGYDIRETQKVEYQAVSTGYLKCFDDLYHQDWVDDGISVEVMKMNNIKYNTLEHQIVIPHYHGRTDELIGIRGRNLMPEPLGRGQKYMPIYIQGNSFAHSLGGNLYGLSRNRETISTLRKVMIVESEKGVLQCETMYGDSNFTVATCSSNISNVQRDMLLECDIDEVILGFDKDFPIDSEEYEQKMKTICKLAQKFAPYVKVYVIEDVYDLLEIHDSPTDKGKEVLEALMKDKIELTMDMIDDIIKGEW